LFFGITRRIRMGLFNWIRNKGARQQSSSGGGTTVAMILIRFLGEMKDEMSGEALDAIRAICNSNFSQSEIQKGLNHPNYKVRRVCEKFLQEITSEFGKLP
jgi:hypothetical protein